MKITFPTIPKTEPKKTRLVMLRLLDIFWHTLLPVISTYYMIHFNQPLVFIGIITPLIVRINISAK